MRKRFLALGVALAAFAVFAEKERSNVLEANPNPQHEFSRTNLNFSALYPSSYPPRQNLTRRERSGRSKGILLVPAKQMMQRTLPKVFLTAGVATQTKLKGGGGGGGWGSQGGGGGGHGGGGHGGGGHGGGGGGGWGGGGGGGHGGGGGGYGGGGHGGGGGGWGMQGGGGGGGWGPPMMGWGWPMMMMCPDKKAQKAKQKAAKKKAKAQKKAMKGGGGGGGWGGGGGGGGGWGGGGQGGGGQGGGGWGQSGGGGGGGWGGGGGGGGKGGGGGGWGGGGNSGGGGGGWKRGGGGGGSGGGGGWGSQGGGGGGWRDDGAAEASEDDEVPPPPLLPFPNVDSSENDEEGWDNAPRGSRVYIATEDVSEPKTYDMLDAPLPLLLGYDLPITRYARSSKFDASKSPQQLDSKHVENVQQSNIANSNRNGLSLTNSSLLLNPLVFPTRGS